MTSLSGRPAAAAVGLMCLLGTGGADSGKPQQRNLGAYASRLAVYRSGEFGTALRASTGFPVGRLRDQAEEFFRVRPDPGPRFSLEALELDFLAAAMLHFDLAWAAGMEPDQNESLARELLARVSDPRRDAWIREAHLGLLGIYVNRGQLDDAVRAAKLLGTEYPDEVEVRIALARLAEFIGWGIHDDRFLDQAQESYEHLLLEGQGDPAELRLRIAHLTLREGNPEEALRRIEEAGDELSARHRFVSLLLRGETLLWLDRVDEAEAAFTEAHAIHVGSISAAAGLAAARQTLGNGRRAAEAARAFLAGSAGQDTWWHFLVQAIADEAGRLDSLRGMILLPQE